MRLFEKHRNGAIIDVDGESAIVAKQIMEWREYQDRITPPKTQVGFTGN